MKTRTHRFLPTLYETYHSKNLSYAFLELIRLYHIHIDQQIRRNIHPVGRKILFRWHLIPKTWYQNGNRLLEFKWIFLMFRASKGRLEITVEMEPFQFWETFFYTSEARIFQINVPTARFLIFFLLPVPPPTHSPTGCSKYILLCF